MKRLKSFKTLGIFSISFFSASLMSNIALACNQFYVNISVNGETFLQKPVPVEVFADSIEFAAAKFSYNAEKKQWCVERRGIYHTDEFQSGCGLSEIQPVFTVGMQIIGHVHLDNSNGSAVLRKFDPATNKESSDIVAFETLPEIYPSKEFPQEFYIGIKAKAVSDTGSILGTVTVQKRGDLNFNGVISKVDANLENSNDLALIPNLLDCELTDLSKK